MIDYESIIQCQDWKGSNGLQCGTECVLIGSWCLEQKSCVTKTTSFTTTNPTLCQNRTFWENISCDKYSHENLFRKGQRCSGRQQHCIYPGYNDYVHSKCKDHSDEVFRVGEECSTELEPSKLKQCQDSCANKTKEIYSYTLVPALPSNFSINDEIEKCKACTNPQYFQCYMNGTLHCIHPDLVCDGHPVCDNNEDEKIGTLCSIEKLIKLNIIKPQATKLCISKMYADKNMMTVAVACDGIEECEKGADESWLCTNSSYLVYGTLCVFLILILLLIVYKLLKGNRVVDDFQPLELQDILDTDIFIEKHDQKIFRDDINLFIQKSKVLDSKSDRIAKNKKLYDLESKFHGGNVAEIRLCIKNTIEWSNAKILIEDMLFQDFYAKILQRDMDLLASE